MLLETILIRKKILWRINFVLIKFSLNALLFEKSWNECKNPSFHHKAMCNESDHGSTKMRCCLSTFVALYTRKLWYWSYSYSAAASQEFSRDLQRFHILSRLSHDDKLFVKIPRTVKFLLQNALKKQKLHVIVSFKYYDSIYKKFQYFRSCVWDCIHCVVQ